MQALRIIGAGVLLAIVSTAALAFQEQRSGGLPSAAPGAVQVTPGTVEQNLSDGTAAGAKSTGGTEVRIPGLGKLGVLPKMDFGLELLYGATESKPVEGEQRGGPAPSEDLSIRGTLKHRF